MNNKLTNILLTILIILVAILTVLRVVDRAELDRNIQNSVQDAISSTEKPKNGINGINGIDGRDGERGITGSQGEKGETGLQGEVGLSAYDIAIENGFVGTEQEWLLSLKAVNGFTPELRCNTTKNRWEVRYEGTLSWRLLNGETVKCVGV